MNNPFLFNNNGQDQPQQQSYQNTQQNQGWNQNLTPSAQATFQSQPPPPQIDFFDMTAPQYNQPQANNKQFTPNDFRSMMNSHSNDSTSQFIQPIQPPRDLNQLRSIFTRDDDPIIAPIVPQTNQPSPQTPSSSYSPSFTFVPEPTNQNQTNYKQPQASQFGQTAVDFSKYDPLAGEIINSNIAKQKTPKENTQSVGAMPNGESIPMVFYGADSTAPTNQMQFGGNFQAPQPNQSFVNGMGASQTNFQQPQPNNFLNNQSQPLPNTFGTQVPQQNTSAFTAQSTQHPATNIFGSPNQQQPDSLTTNNQAQQANIDFFNTSINQPTTNFFGNQTQQQQNTGVNNAPIDNTIGIQNKQQQNTNFFNIPNAQSTNSNEIGNPFIPSNPKIQAGGFEANPFLNNSNNVPDTKSGNINASPDNNTTESKPAEVTNSAPASFDIFRIGSDQPNQQSLQFQQGSDTISNITLNSTNHTNSLDDIFGITTSKAPPKQTEQQPEPFHPFGQTQINQPESTQNQSEPFHPFSHIPANQQESSQEQSEPFHPFGQIPMQQQESAAKPKTVSSENPFALDNIFQSNANSNTSAPKSEPTFVSVDDSYNPFGQSLTDKENPFSGTPNQQKTPASENPQNIFDNSLQPPKPSETNEKVNPFVGIAPSNENPFVSNTNSSSSQNPAISPPPPAAAETTSTSNNNNAEEPFDPFGRNSKSNSDNKKETSKSSIDYMRSLFASNMDDLFTKNNDQQSSPSPSSATPEETTAKVEQQSQNSDTQQQQATTENDNSQANQPAFDPFGVGNALPMVEGASFTFSIDEQNESEKPNEQSKEDTKTQQETKTDTTNSNTYLSPFSPFDIPPPLSQPQQQQTQSQKQQQPQIVDDLFFDFSSVPSSKSDSNENNASNAPKSDENKPDASVATTNYNENNEEENIPVGTDESSMSLSSSSAELITPQQNKENNLNEEESKGLELQKSGSVGFYSDGVNSFTFNPQEELQKGPNPFIVPQQDQNANQSQPQAQLSSSSSNNSKFNPFIQNTEQQSTQKFNPFAIPPPPSSSNTNQNAANTDIFKSTTATANDSKNAGSTDVFKSTTTAANESKNAASTDVFKSTTATTNTDVFKSSSSNDNKAPLKAVSSTSDASFNPFGQSQKVNQESKKEETKPANPEDGKSKANENSKTAASTSVFSPFGQSQPKDQEAKKEETNSVENKNKAQESANNDSFNPFGQVQPSSNNNNNATFNPFGQIFTSKVSQSSSADQHSFTFTLRSNQTPDVDDSDFLPVNSAMGPQSAQTSTTSAPSEHKQQEQSFSPFGTFSPQQQQQQQQPSSPFTFNSSQPATFSDDTQNSQNQNNEATQKEDSSSSLSFRVRKGSSSPTDPFTLLIASLTPFTEDETNENIQLQSQVFEQNYKDQKQQEQQQQEEAAGEDKEETKNPFASWNPNELDKALGECKEPEEIVFSSLNRFNRMAPKPPSFVTFEQSPAAQILKEYCAQLSTTDSSLEHINELLGIQDTARISIEDF